MSGCLDNDISYVSTETGTGNNVYYVGGDGSICDRESNVTDVHGVLPVIKVNLYYLLPCGHAFDKVTYQEESESKLKSNLDYCSYYAWTYTCSICGCSVEEIDSKKECIAHKYSEPESTYSNAGESGHYEENNQTCSLCEFLYTSRSGTIEQHTIEVRTSLKYSYNSSGHWHIETSKCTKSGCTYSKSVNVDYEGHTSNAAGTGCAKCSYKGMISGTEFFTSSSHDDCCDCLTDEVVIQYALLDDKKKIQQQLMFDEKRYINDLIQLPRVGT